jgi:hypothetical protein
MLFSLVTLFKIVAYDYLWIPLFLLQHVEELWKLVHLEIVVDPGCVEEWNPKGWVRRMLQIIQLRQEFVSKSWHSEWLIHPDSF